MLTHKQKKRMLLKGKEGKFLHGTLKPEIKKGKKERER